MRLGARDVSQIKQAYDTKVYFPSSTVTAVSFNIVKYNVYDAVYNLYVVLYA